MYGNLLLVAISSINEIYIGISECSSGTFVEHDQLLVLDKTYKGSSSNNVRERVYQNNNKKDASIKGVWVDYAITVDSEQCLHIQLLSSKQSNKWEFQQYTLHCILWTNSNHVLDYFLLSNEQSQWTILQAVSAN